jgi:hypothetical protein
MTSSSSGNRKYSIMTVGSWVVVAASFEMYVWEILDLA